MAIQQVSVSFTAPGAGTQGAPAEFRGMERYVISIPNPGGSPVQITGYRPLDSSVDDVGNYRDGNIQTARNHDYMFHSITDASGNQVRVLMTDQEWNRYQTALSDFAVAAANSPNIYKPNNASLGGGVFTPQVQAGGGASALRAFHPISDQRMTSMGVTITNEGIGLNGHDLDVTLYDPGNNANVRAALLQAGYVEVNVDGKMMFASPADAAIHTGQISV